MDKIKQNIRKILLEELKEVETGDIRQKSHELAVKAHMILMRRWTHTPG